MSEHAPGTPKTEHLRSKVLQELAGKHSTDLEPTLTIERDALRGSMLVHLHASDPDVRLDDEEVEEEFEGVIVYSCLFEEQVQDNYYELRLNFNTHVFEHLCRRTVYEGGDGIYETVFRGSFTKEVAPGSRKNSMRGSIKRSSSKGANIDKSGSPRSPRGRSEPVAYFVCRVDSRDFSSNWEPWDPRVAAEHVVRKGDSFHQEMLFRVIEDGVVNENVVPHCVLKLVEPKEN